MVKRLVNDEDIRHLRDWFLEYMKGENHGGFRDSWREGFTIGPSQLCSRAGVNVSLGTRLFGDGKSARPYVPFPEYLRRLAAALHAMLEERGDPRAGEVSVIRAFIEGGYLTVQDVADFVEGEGLAGWMREEDCLLDLDRLSEEGQLVVRGVYDFWRFKEAGEEVGH